MRKKGWSDRLAEFLNIEFRPSDCSVFGDSSANLASTTQWITGPLLSMVLPSFA
jgi:hypothetical protein